MLYHGNGGALFYRIELSFFLVMSWISPIMQKEKCLYVLPCTFNCIFKLYVPYTGAVRSMEQFKNISLKEICGAVGVCLKNACDWNGHRCLRGTHERFLVCISIRIVCALTHLCPPLRLTFAVRETASLGQQMLERWV